MIEPKGPLPRGTYLRRRALALAGVVAGVVGLIWLITLLVGGEDDPQVRGTAGTPAAPTSPPPPTSPPAPTGSSPTPPAAPTPSTPAAVTPPPPDPDLPCPDAAMTVTAEVGAPSYRVGQRPALRLVVTNTGPVPCTRDVGRALRELVVTSADGATRVWSNNDCAKAAGARAQVVRPGERLVFEITWAGRTSAPGCPIARTVAGPGAYLLVPRLGPVVGPGVALTLVP